MTAGRIIVLKYVTMTNVGVKQSDILIPSKKAWTALSTQFSKCCNTRTISLLLLLGTTALTALICDKNKNIIRGSVFSLKVIQYIQSWTCIHSLLNSCKNITTFKCLFYLTCMHTSSSSTNIYIVISQTALQSSDHRFILAVLKPIKTISRHDLTGGTFVCISLITDEHFKKDEAPFWCLLLTFSFILSAVPPWDMTIFEAVSNTTPELSRKEINKTPMSVDALNRICKPLRSSICKTKHPIDIF